MNKLPQSVLDFDEFLNEPPEYEELHKVRDYRHRAYPKWKRALEDMRKLIQPSPAEITDEEILDLLSEHLTFDRQAPDYEVCMNKWGHEITSARLLRFCRALLQKGKAS